MSPGLSWFLDEWLICPDIWFNRKIFTKQIVQKYFDAQNKNLFKYSSQVKKSEIYLKKNCPELFSFNGGKPD